jgi:hypothetical protein
MEYKPYKIALFGKANSGKDTTANLIGRSLEIAVNGSTAAYGNYELIAFATPIKKMLELMFPLADRQCLYGPSHLRNEILPHSLDRSGRPLTYRQVLIDLGKLGRTYDEDHWVKVFAIAEKKLPVGNSNDLYKCAAYIATDGRYRNEFNYLRSNGYIIIRINRKVDTIIDDTSETAQDAIKDSEFDFILDNNGTLQDLQDRVSILISKLRKEQ